MNILWVLLIFIWESMKNAYLFSGFFRFEKSTFNLRARTPKTHAAFHANENLWLRSYYQHLSLIFVLFVLNGEKSIAKSYDEFLFLFECVDLNYESFYFDAYASYEILSSRFRNRARWARETRIGNWAFEI